MAPIISPASPNEFVFRVDFLGPPGVGKSTLCKAVLEHNDNNHRESTEGLEWKSMIQAQILAEQNALRFGIPVMGPNRRIQMFLRLLRHGVENYLWQGYRKPFQLQELATLQDKLLVNFLEEYHALFVAVTEQWFDPDMAPPPLPARYDELLHWTKNWLFSIIWAGPARILADNSRFTRGVAELYSNDEYGNVANNTTVAKSFCLSPMCPNGIVHIEDNSKAILERIRLRQKENGGWLHPGHRSLSDSEILAYTEKRIERNASAIRFFGSRGVAVTTLIASTPLNENVREVQRFLDVVVAGAK